jgi:DNA-binding NtrC family response regulator
LARWLLSERLMLTPARVLLVEDDVATLDLFSDALRRAGFEVDGARRRG